MFSLFNALVERELVVAAVLGRFFWADLFTDEGKERTGNVVRARGGFQNRIVGRDWLYWFRVWEGNGRGKLK